MISARVLAGTMLIAAIVLGGCATGSRMHSHHVPQGALRMAQAVHVFEGATAFDPREREVYELLSQGGLSDADIRSGAVVFARVFCCGANERANAIAFFAPNGLPVRVGDFVEVRSGRAGDAKALNVATRVWQSQGEAPRCRWLPDIPSLAARVIYCDGMKEHGWVQQSGLWNVWMRPPEGRP
jgi:hypothetical protein